MGGLLAAGQPDQAAGCAWNLGWAGWAELGLGQACFRQAWGRGWVGLTGLASRRVAGWAGPEPSLRHVRQAWPHAFQDKKATVILAIVSTFSTKMDPWSSTPTNPENFKARRTGFWVQPTWVGGGGAARAKFGWGGGWGRGKAKILFGEEI